MTRTPQACNCRIGDTNVVYRTDDGMKRVPPPAIQDAINRWLAPTDEVNCDDGIHEPHCGCLTNTADLLEIGARWGDLIHIQDGSVTVSFADIVRSADRFAVTLAQHGVDRGDRVFIHGRNSAAWVAAAWGVWRAAAVPVLGNPSWTSEEVRHALAVTTSQFAVVDSSLMDRLPSGAQRWRLDDIDFDEKHVDDSWSRLLDDRAREVAANDAAAVVFTSGTTEFAKAAVLTHRTFALNLQGFLALTGKTDRVVRREPAPTALITAPLFHIGGIHGVVRSLVEGSKRIFSSGRFDAGEVLRILETEKIRSLFLVPTALTRLLSHPDFAHRDLSSLRSATLGAAPVPPSLLEQLRTAIPSLKVGVNTGYGLTEAGGAVTAASGADVAARPGTAGRALPWAEIRIDNPDEHGRGEIGVRSGAQMLGYLTPNGLAEEPANSGGWVMTGDLGRIDDDGFLWVEGRSKDIIIRGGENISAARVEAVLHAHPAVLEAAAVGLRDPEWGEVVAVVVRVSSDDIDEQELADHASTLLARFEIPAHWQIVRDPLPTNAMGKILKRELLQLFEDRPSPDTRPAMT
ncbi:class I adenylate-forming enzyme family protein [Rhodococcus koreensis]